MKRRYRCWNKYCSENMCSRWFTKKELRKQVIDDKHTDYKCPYCDSTIICEGE